MKTLKDLGAKTFALTVNSVERLNEPVAGFAANLNVNYDKTLKQVIEMFLPDNKKGFVNVYKNNANILLSLGNINASLKNANIVVNAGIEVSAALAGRQIVCVVYNRKKDDAIYNVEKVDNQYLPVIAVDKTTGELVSPATMDSVVFELVDILDVVDHDVRTKAIQNLEVQCLNKVFASKSIAQFFGESISGNKTGNSVAKIDAKRFIGDFNDDEELPQNTKPSDEMIVAEKALQAAQDAYDAKPTASNKAKLEAAQEIVDQLIA